MLMMSLAMAKTLATYAVSLKGLVGRGGREGDREIEREREREREHREWVTATAKRKSDSAGEKRENKWGDSEMAGQEEQVKRGQQRKSDGDPRRRRTLRDTTGRYG